MNDLRLSRHRAHEFLKKFSEFSHGTCARGKCVLSLASFSVQNFQHAFLDFARGCDSIETGACHRAGGKESGEARGFPWIAGPQETNEEGCGKDVARAGRVHLRYFGRAK